MQNLFRFVLAWLVVVAHLTEGVRETAHMGRFAVFGFYLLSGYLITMVLNDVYKFRTVPFFLNRILRIFPVYWIICIVTLIIILWLPGASDWKSAWNVSAAPNNIIGNLLIFPFEFLDSSFRLVPPAWSVGVELINYFLLWLIVARRNWIAAIVLIGSIGFHIWTYQQSSGLDARYSPFLAALLPFSLGACIYFARKWTDRLSTGFVIAAIITGLLLWIANLLVSAFTGSLWGPNLNTHFYLNLTTLTIVVSGFSHKRFRTKATGWVKLLGDLSYPVFLIHWQAGFLMSFLFLDSKNRGWDVLLYSIPTILILAWSANYLAEKFIEPSRNKLRPS